MWINVPEQKLATMKFNDVWEPVDMPREKNVIKTKSFFDVERNNSDSIAKYKARFVAQGFNQKAAYSDIFDCVEIYCKKVYSGTRCKQRLV